MLKSATLKLLAGAAVALTLGAAIELQNRQGRDKHAAAEAEARRALAWHREQVDICDRALASNAAARDARRPASVTSLGREAGFIRSPGGIAISASQSAGR